MAKKFKKCLVCEGSGHIFKPVPDTSLVFVENCLTCKGTGRVPVDEPEDERRREMGKAFHTGDNT